MRYYFLLVFFFCLPLFAFAVEVKTFTDIPFLDGPDKSTGGYVQALYNLAIGIAAILAVGKLIWVGTRYMLSESVTGKFDAKASIQSTLLGLLIIMSAVLILTTINPQLANVNVIGSGGSVTITPPPIGSGGEKFMPGGEWRIKKIIDHCSNFSSVFVNQSCVREYVQNLKTSCLQNGGTRIEKVGNRVYKCIKD